MKKRKQHAAKSIRAERASEDISIPETPAGDGTAQPEQSPGRFLLLLWGLPFLVILAAVAVRMMKGD